MMTRILYVVLTLALIAIGSVQAQQVPQGFNYQGIARDANGGVVAGQTVNLRLSIIDGATTASEYVETHQVSTNSYGLFTTQIGNGTPFSGTFAGVTWENGNKLLQAEVDLGSGFIDLGSAPLQSVPYALVAGGLAGPITLTVDDLSDVTAGAPANGQVLKWDGTTWVAGDDVAGFELPFADTASSTALTPLFLVRQEGTGPGIHLQGGNGVSSSSLLVIENNGRGEALSVTARGEQSSGGIFRIDNRRSGDRALSGVTNGVGNAGYFEINNLTNDSAAVRAFTNGTAAGVYGESSGNGRAYGLYGVANGECITDFSGLRTICPIGLYGTASFGPGVYGHGSDVGPGVQAYSENGHAFVGLGPTETPGFSDMRFYVANTGKAYAEGSYFTPRSFSSGRNAMATLIPPGDTGIGPEDLLVVSGAGAFVASSNTNMTTVVGVAVANPAFVAGNPLDDDGNSTSINEIALATSGIVTIKVNDENGQIAPGDLLVSSSERGHAMKAPDDPASGTIVAKALEMFGGPGSGSIKAIVMLR